MGAGCAVQALGFIFLIIGGALGGSVGIVIGIFVLLAFLVVGSRMSIKWSCSACKNPIANGKVSMCPSCKVSLA
jgi:hypothetical protein